VFVCERGRTSDVLIRCIERKGEKRERERERQKMRERERARERE